MSLIAELKRRKVFKVGVAYLVVGWLLIQIAATIAPQLNLPEWAPRLMTFIILLGFPIAILLAWVVDLSPDGIKIEAATVGNKRMIATAAVLTALALAWYFYGQPAFHKGEVAPTVAVAPAPVVQEDHSIAVLPFVDMSQGKDQEYFSDGLSEELLNLLAQVPQLRVIARTSSFSFKGKEVDVATIAKTLNVANVLEGSVRKSGDTLRITAQLIRAADSSHLWSETYDRKLTDVFKVQDEIAGAVVAALKVKLLPTQQVGNPYQTNNTEAYNQYLLGNQFWNGDTPDNLRSAAQAYRRAIALDPNYAAAYAGLSMDERYLALSAQTAAEYTEGVQRALVAAEKAVALAPDLADGYVARGSIRTQMTWDWAGAQADLEKALALNAGDSTVQRRYADLLATLGQLPAAIAVTRKATELDPLSTAAWSNLSGMLNDSGQYAEARQALQRVQQLSPDDGYAFLILARIELLQGQAKKALLLFKEHRQVDPVTSLIGVAMAEHSLGHATESQQALDEAIAKYAPVAAYQIAGVFAWRGEKDQAFAWLQRAYAQRNAGFAGIKTDPLLAALRGDPRYTQMLRKLGLPE